jgi:ATP-dependent DNA helicase RecQ
VLRLQRERGQKFGAGQSIDILLGRRTEKVSQHSHDALTVFGIGTELTEAQWRGVVRQLLAQGLLDVEGDYGTLVLNDASSTVLRKEREVTMRREPERLEKAGRSGGSSRSGRGGGSKGAAAAVDLAPEAVEVFERLRAWRGAVAKEQGMPAYVIFHDATLRQIAAQAPATLVSLGTVSGVGAAKLEKYGEQILGVLQG